jgi:hypothetical protein
MFEKIFSPQISIKKHLLTKQKSRKNKIENCQQTVNEKALKIQNNTNNIRIVPQSITSVLNQSVKNIVLYDDNFLDISNNNNNQKETRKTQQLRFEKNTPDKDRQIKHDNYKTCCKKHESVNFFYLFCILIIVAIISAFFCLIVKYLKK